MANGKFHKRHVVTDNSDLFGHTGIKLRRPNAIVAPESWWLEADRDGFTNRALKEVPRMQLSRFAGAHEAMAS